MKLKHVQTQYRGGKAYRYLRVPGKSPIRLPDLPMEDPAFLLAYAEAMQELKPPRRGDEGSIDALITAFLRSTTFAGLSADYGRVIRRHLDEIREQAGGARAAHIRQNHIREDMDPLAPHAARSRLKAWRLLCAYGVDRGVLQANPSDGIKRKKLPRSQGHIPWTADEIETFRGHWPVGSVQRLVFEVIFWSAARIGDAVNLGPGMIGRDGVLAYRQSKTGDLAFVPWTSEQPFYATDRHHLHEVLSAIETRHMTFLATAQGRTRSHKAVGGLVSEAARDAGLKDRSAHGLRKSRAILLAEGGASVHQIASWTGHATLDEVAHYTEELDRRRASLGASAPRGSRQA